MSETIERASRKSMGLPLWSCALALLLLTSCVLPELYPTPTAPSREGAIGYVARIMGSGPVFINDRRVSEQTKIFSGDKIKTGNAVKTRIELYRGVTVYVDQNTDPGIFLSIEKIILYLRYGQIAVDSHGSKVAVQTEAGETLETTGTVFNVRSIGPVTVLTVVQGGVRFTDATGKSVVVPAGHQITSQRGRLVLPPVRVPVESVIRWILPLRGQHVVPPLQRPGWCCRNGNLFQVASEKQCRAQRGIFFSDRYNAQRNCIPPAKPGWCCRNGNLFQVASERQCRAQRGTFFSDRYNAQRNCTPPAKPGWCCRNGNLFQVASERQCRAQSGIFFSDRYNAQRNCTPPAKPGWCCRNGNLFQVASERQCRAQRGIFFSDRYNAQRNCIPPAKPGWCCVRGSLFAVSSEQQCRARRGVFFPNRDAAKGKCLPRVE